jgi:hypothetical protein
VLTPMNQVAHYDTLALAPGLACGADANGSGVAAVVALLRLFGWLYDDAAARGSFDLLFVLTVAAPLGFQGAQHWVRSPRHFPCDHPHSSHAALSIFTASSHHATAVAACINITAADVAISSSSRQTSTSEPPPTSLSASLLCQVAAARHLCDTKAAV